VLAEKFKGPSCHATAAKAWADACMFVHTVAPKYTGEWTFWCAFYLPINAFALFEL
jgi:hypothetical protein